MKAKFLLRLSPLLLLALPSCVGTGVAAQDHWSVRGGGARIQRQFFGNRPYSGQTLGAYWGEQYDDTAQGAKRQFINHNRSNPLQRSLWNGELRLDSSPLDVPKPPSPEKFEVRNK